MKKIQKYSVKSKKNEFSEEELAKDFFARPIKMNRPKSFDFKEYRRKMGN